MSVSVVMATVVDPSVPPVRALPVKREICPVGYVRHAGHCSTYVKEDGKLSYYVTFEKKTHQAVYTLKEADDLRGRLSMEKGLSMYIMPTDKMTLEVAQYISGFLDGDGCIGQERDVARITFMQATNIRLKTPPVLQFIYKYIGGRISADTKPQSPESRFRQSLRIGGQQAKLLLQLVKNHTILKSNQCELALQLYERDADHIHIAKQLKQCKQLSELQKLCGERLPTARLSLPYISGLFDAEGCVALYGTNLEVSITQKSSTHLLQSIREFCGIQGYMSKWGVWRTSGSKALHFLKLIQPFLVQKKDQVDATLSTYEEIYSTHRGGVFTETNRMLLYNLEEFLRSSKKA